MLKHADEISTIIEKEIGCPQYTFQNHNSKSVIVEFYSFEVFVDKGIDPQEFRAKVAEAFLDRVQHLLQQQQSKVNEAERELKNLISIYKHYLDIVSSIAEEKLESLDLINWKKHKNIMW